MLNFKLGWPSALRSSTSSASLSASASASSDQSPASPSSSSTLARSNSTASLKKKTPAPGIPASVRYFAIFDPRPPPSPPQDKGKGKQRAVEDDNVEQQEAGGAGEEPPSTTVLFYSSPSEPTTTQTTIQRRLGLASAIVQFTTDLSGQSQKRSHTFSDPRTWQRWSVTASKTRTLTLRVRPALYLHVVIELPRLPRSATLKSKDKSGGTVRSSVKWEYVGNAVVDEPIFEAMVKAWNAFVVSRGTLRIALLFSLERTFLPSYHHALMHCGQERCGEPPDRYTQQDSDQTKPEQARPAKASRREGDEDDDDDEGDEEARFHRALENSSRSSTDIIYIFATSLANSLHFEHLARKHDRISGKSSVCAPEECDRRSGQ
ncbi:hypothetical protein OC845_000570 [Tilletia horrida]|nr:hypothetical protein OC845_000570 [Tilletia horrida]